MHFHISRTCISRLHPKPSSHVSNARMSDTVLTYSSAPSDKHRNSTFTNHITAGTKIPYEEQLLNEVPYCSCLALFLASRDNRSILVRIEVLNRNTVKPIRSDRIQTLLYTTEQNSLCMNNMFEKRRRLCGCLTRAKLSSDQLQIESTLAALSLAQHNWRDHHGGIINTRC